MYQSEGVDGSMFPLTIVSKHSYASQGRCCHCTYKDECHLTDEKGVHILRRGETEWDGAFLCERHAREYSLLW